MHAPERATPFVVRHARLADLEGRDLDGVQERVPLRRRAVGGDALSPRLRSLEEATDLAHEALDAGREGVVARRRVELGGSLVRENGLHGGTLAPVLRRGPN